MAVRPLEISIVRPAIESTKVMLDLYDYDQEQRKQRMAAHGMVEKVMSDDATCIIKGERCVVVQRWQGKAANAAVELAATLSAPEGSQIPTLGPATVLVYCATDRPPHPDRNPVQYSIKVPAEQPILGFVVNHIMSENGVLLPRWVTVGIGASYWKGRLEISSADLRSHDTSARRQRIDATIAAGREDRDDALEEHKEDLEELREESKMCEFATHSIVLNDKEYWARVPEVPDDDAAGENYHDHWADLLQEVEDQVTTRALRVLRALPTCSVHHTPVHVRGSVVYKDVDGNGRAFWVAPQGFCSSCWPTWARLERERSRTGASFGDYTDLQA